MDGGRTRAVMGSLMVMLLLEALDQTPVKPFATFWWWDTDAEEWQLVIASDMVDNEGPTQALREIQRVLRSEERPLKAVELREVLVVGRHDRRAPPRPHRESRQ